jgi:hypothetical protein
MVHIGSDAPERRQQVDLWLGQIGIDAALLGMEQLVTQWRERGRRLTSAGTR